MEACIITLSKYNMHKINVKNLSSHVGALYMILSKHKNNNLFSSDNEKYFVRFVKFVYLSYTVKRPLIKNSNFS